MENGNSLQLFASELFKVGFQYIEAALGELQGHAPEVHTGHRGCACHAGFDINLLKKDQIGGLVIIWQKLSSKIVFTMIFARIQGPRD